MVFSVELEFPKNSNNLVKSVTFSNSDIRYFEVMTHQYTSPKCLLVRDAWLDWLVRL